PARACRAAPARDRRSRDRGSGPDDRARADAGQVDRHPAQAATRARARRARAEHARDLAREGTAVAAGERVMTFTLKDTLAPVALTQGRAEAALAGRTLAGRYDVL